MITVQDVDRLAQFPSAARSLLQTGRRDPDQLAAEYRRTHNLPDDAPVTICRYIGPHQIGGQDWILNHVSG